MALFNDETLKKRIRNNYIKVNDHWIVEKYTNGYGRLYAHGKTWLAHRISYEVFVGPIPEGMEIDHVCRVTNCIQPTHLEPVTRAENMKRAQKTVCKRGHPLSGKNISTSNGTRQCLKCRAIREAKRRARRVAS